MLRSTFLRGYGGSMGCEGAPPPNEKFNSPLMVAWADRTVVAAPGTRFQPKSAGIECKFWFGCTKSPCYERCEVSHTLEPRYVLYVQADRMILVLEESILFDEKNIGNSVFCLKMLRSTLFASSSKYSYTKLSIYIVGNFWSYWTWERITMRILFPIGKYNDYD